MILIRFLLRRQRETQFVSVLVPYVLYFKHFHIQSISCLFACWCKRTLKFVHRSKVFFWFKLGLGYCIRFKLAGSIFQVATSSNSVWAAWRWRYASPDVVVQHLGLSVLSTAGINHSLHRKGAGFEKSLRIRGQTLHSKVEADPSRIARLRREDERARCTWACKQATSIHGCCLFSS